ncbi:MAG: ribosome hibernation-promoting factor, HPF/YfiA family [Acidothermaceae bacterium]
MLDIVVTGRHVDVPARLRTHAQEKLAKVEKLCPKAIRVDVEVSRERNPRMSEICERVELTCISRGPAIRAEAAADELIAAFDLAWAKLESRLRKSADRRRVHRGSRTPVSVAAATAAIGATGSGSTGGSGSAGPTGSAGPAGSAGSAALLPDEPLHISDNSPESSDPYDSMVDHQGDGPMLVREKLHHAPPMSLDQALYEMELVGHDFFLFSDKESGLPSVVYRRRGYDYGVIRLDTGADVAVSMMSGAERNGSR